MTINEEKYFSFLNNKILFEDFRIVKAKKLTEKETKKYYSFLNAKEEMIKYSQSKDKKISHQYAKLNNKTKKEIIIDNYIDLAKEEYSEIYSKDDGFLFKIYFQKLHPLKEEVILNWSDKELNRTADYTTIVSKITQRYRDLKAYDIMQKYNKDLREEPTIWTKLRGYKTSLTDCRLAVSKMKDQLLLLLKESNDLLNELDKNSEKIIILSGCLDIVSKKAMREKQNGGIYHYLYNKRDTLMSARIQSNLLPIQLKAIVEEIANLIMNIDEMISVTIPTIELSRANL